MQQGHVWGGGRCNIDRCFYLTINDDQQQVLIAKEIADRINRTLHSPVQGSRGGEMATVEPVGSKAFVLLDVPPQYRHNLPRYLRVVRLMPVSSGGKKIETGRKSAVTTGDESAYRSRVEQDLLDPEHTVTAALRLEALGTESIRR